ncbi:MAG TPA: S9 family peptidase [Thermoanaerobaculia bacterium]|jgi:dipeptidyl aminopeptidase/acylaminoacyl peptidase|nr:S9 family peptidase [Thermoanaerobaculia bacterium]
MKSFARFAVVAAVICVSSVASAERLQYADRTRLVNLSDPQLSPDGRSVVVLVSRANLKDNRNDSELVLVDIGTAAQRPLTSERRGLAQPRWSPDGERLAFLANASSDATAKRQIWIQSMHGGDARKITDAANGVQQFAWSPDGARVAYVTADEAPKKSDADKHNRSFEIHDDDFLINTTTLSSHLWLVPSNGGEAKRLTSGEWSLPVSRPPGPLPSPINWSPDGKWIAFSKSDTPYSGNGDTTRIALIDAASGEIKPLASAQLQQTQPMLSPDGKQVAFTHAHEGERGSENRIWLAPSSGGAATQLASNIDRNLYRAFWMPDGKSLLVGAHDDTSTSLWLQPLDGPSRRLDLGDLEPAAPFSIEASVARNGTIAIVGSTPKRPRELYVLSSLTAKPRRLTDFNAHFETLDLGRAERITFSNDGYDLDGVLITPPGFDSSRKYPLVLYIHGGPRSSSTTGFSFLPQLFAAQGWAVFMPNYRGSDNLGNRITRAIIMDAGAGPGRDVMAGLEVLKKRGFVDESRIAVGGWSYGGMMTSWMVGHYPIFKTAVSGAAVNNFLDQYVLGDYNVGRKSSWGSPYAAENMKLYMEQSPITYAANIRTPMLILSNTGDARVPITQSFQMYRALRDNNVPTKFIAYPLSGHFPEDPVHTMDIDRRYVEWFAEYLK